MSGALARWRVAARIARRDAQRNRGRTVLVAIMVGLPVFLAAAGSVLITSANPTDGTWARWVLGDQAQATISAPTGGTYLQDPAGRTGASSGDTADTAVSVFEASLTAALPTGDRLVRVVQGQAALATASHRLPPTVGVTSFGDGYPPDLAPLTSGALPIRADQVALSERRADTLRVRVGDPVSIEVPDAAPVEATVTGILAPRPPAGTIAEVVVGPGVITPPETLRGDFDPYGANATVTWVVTGPEAVTWDDVLAINDLGSSVTSRAVIADPPPRSQVPFFHSDFGPVYGSEQIMMFVAVGALIVLEAVLLIGPAFAVAARRSQRQLALLAAVGAERSTLRASVLWVGVLTGLVASAIGVVAGLAVGAAIVWLVHLTGHPYALPNLRPSTWLLAGFATFGIVVTTLAAWLPSRRASRVDVLAALGGRRAEAAPHRGVPILGVVAIGAGAAACAVGASIADPRALLGGVAVLTVGVVAASGGLVSLTARLAPRLGLSGRLAVRDAARHRSRTAPAVAAVLAATAGALAGAVYSTSQAAYTESIYVPVAATGTVLVGIDPSALTQMDAGEVDNAAASAAAALRRTLPVSDVEVVHIAAPTSADRWSTGIQPSTAPGQDCPLWAGGEPTRQQRRAAADDPRCTFTQTMSYAPWAGFGGDTLVDDGTVLRATGLDGSAAAADALAAGKVVAAPTTVFPDGTVHLDVTDYGSQDPTTATLASAELPAEGMWLPGYQYSLVLPPSALDRLGLTSEVAGLIAPTTRTPTDAEIAAANAAVGPGFTVNVERGHPYGTDVNLTQLALVGAAVIAAIVATGIAVALAGADSVPDLATLSAVGAAPRVRRRFAAGQAGVIAVLGGWLGVLTGVAVGWALVTMQGATYNQWGLHAVIPWYTVAATAIALPAAAMALGWLSTRSRLPVVRRMAG